ncbi:MAG: TRAP transporter substrate-binding protein DctP [Alphaproteobacteria bacterium]|nr:TRAP transporter substrate-binding protein DctP [Alphaproteobacteria bacterium]
MNLAQGKKALLSAVAAAALTVVGAASAMADVKPVTIRIAADLTGPPHPAGISMSLFKELVEKKMPGSEVRLFFAGSLYRIPEAVEAMTDGNLEMTWGQFGKTAAVDPYMNVVVGAQLLTTPGAINSLDSFETFKFLQDRMNKVHDVHIFGSGHLSMYMGAGSGSRLISPADFKGKKMRSMGPAENALLGAIGANPTTMAFGDVPPALQTGVIDGLLTSLGGFNSTKDQAPFFTIAGINGIVGDYYWIGASNSWWNKLDTEQQAILNGIIINEVLPFQKKINFCNDKRLVDKYETKDPSKPGIYIMNAAEAGAIKTAAGTATADWIKSKTPDAANMWVDKFAMEAAAAVAANPVGSSDLEKTDCAAMAKWFTTYERYKKPKKKK